MFSKIWTMKSTENYSDNIKRLKQAIDNADAILIGAGAGLSSGLTDNIKTEYLTAPQRHTKQ